MEDVPARNSATLSTKRCVPSASTPTAVIAITTILGAIALAAVAALSAVWVRLNRHAMGPPGEHALLQLLHLGLSEHLCCSDIRQHARHIDRFGKRTALLVAANVASCTSGCRIHADDHACSHVQGRGSL